MGRAGRPISRGSVNLPGLSCLRSHAAAHDEFDDYDLQHHVRYDDDWSHHHHYDDDLHTQHDDHQRYIDDAPRVCRLPVRPRKRTGAGQV